jgi:hypothetical protein
MTEIINLLLDCDIKLSDCHLKIPDNDKTLLHYDMVCNFVKNEDIDKKEYQDNRDINNDNNDDDNNDDDDNDDNDELFEIEIDDVLYFVSDEENGILYEITTHGEVGKKVGIIKDGEPIFKYNI